MTTRLQRVAKGVGSWASRGTLVPNWAYYLVLAILWTHIIDWGVDRWEQHVYTVKLEACVDAHQHVCPLDAKSYARLTYKDDNEGDPDQ